MVPLRSSTYTITMQKEMMFCELPTLSVPVGKEKNGGSESQKRHYMNGMGLRLTSPI